MKVARSRFLIGIAAGISLFLAACQTNTTVSVVDGKYQQTDQQADKPCDIQFFRNNKPDSNYETLAKIESHVQKNFFFGGTAKLEDEAYSELRKKACAVGGNAVLIDDYVESKALEFSHVHVWATAIRLK